MADTVGAVFQESRAAQAFERIRPQLEAIKPEEVRRPNADLSHVAVKVLGVAQEVERRGWRGRFSALSGAGWDVANLEQLEDLAWACWYAHQRRLAQRALESKAQIPLDLLQHSQALRGHMLKTVAHNLEDDPSVARALAEVRRGKGYLDLARDLLDLAELYRAHHERLARDGNHYSAQNAQDAQELARQIVAALGQPAQGSWEDLAFRAWTQLSVAYQEVLAAADFLFRADPEARRAFVSLAAPRG